ncbi:LysE family translocator [Brevibacterium luteolum]|uniref:LysE family translocator n=1 Tax=Brevibacterium luteolum TaxID=199591 RepID=A0A6G8KV44_9MICO|nr:LysE family translocator [Brevibacterium luteolum]QIN28516.1 LysE family translocator [Brevibacterium luteolum]
MNIEWQVYLALVLVSYISPGPDTVMILRASVNGHRAGLFAAAGALTGLAVHMLISALGLAALLLTLPGSLTILTLIGAAYLAYLGIRAIVASHQIRRAPQNTPDSAKPLPGRDSGWSVFRHTLLTNLTNPKVILFFMAVLPQFIDQSSAWPVALQLGLLGAVDVLVGVAYLPLLVLFGTRIFHGLGTRGLANMELSAGTALLIFAGILAHDVATG